jgi:hypothetical protein
MFILAGTACPHTSSPVESVCKETTKVMNSRSLSRNLVRINQC